MDVLVIGCGSIGTRHISNLQDSGDVSTVFACDTDESAAERTEQQHGIWVTTSLEAAWDLAPDAVFVCTPPDTHLDLARTALEHEAHVFIEKPLSDSIGDASDFVDRASRLDLTVMVGCNMRYHPPVVQIDEWLSEGAIGSIEHVRLRYGNRLSNWRPGDYQQYYSTDPERGGGVILDAIHELDIALEWLACPETVQSVAGRYGDLDIPVEDSAEILLEGSNQLAVVELDYLRPERTRMYELIGSGGLIQWVARGKNPEESTLRMYRSESNTWTRESYELTLNEMYVEELRQFFECIATDRSPDVDHRKGRDALSVALTAKTAAQSGCRQSLEADTYIDT